MNAEIFAFERSHSIEISAAPGAVLDYVTNPNTWPQWIAASHKLESPDRPLTKGDRFREFWHTRSGEVTLDWVVIESTKDRLWIGETGAAFIGPIIVRYDVEIIEGGSHFTRTMINPARPKPPSDAMIRRMDEEAEISLANIKRNVEAKAGL